MNEVKIPERGVRPLQRKNLLRIQLRIHSCSTLRLKIQPHRCKAKWTSPCSRGPVGRVRATSLPLTLRAAKRLQKKQIAAALPMH
jgi:hypothetical protein